MKQPDDDAKAEARAAVYSISEAMAAFFASLPGDVDIRADWLESVWARIGELEVHGREPWCYREFDPIAAWRRSYSENEE